MRPRELASLAFLALLPLGVVGCGGEPAKGGGAPATPPHEDHKSPHGGAILELGEEEAHVELVHDAKAGSLAIYVYGKSLDAPASVEAPTILLASKDGPRELKPTALGGGGSTSAAWTLTDDGLKTDPLDGRIRVTVAGKSFQSPLEPAGHGR